ncbi:hypothetical protein MSG_00887 [Mycobacterium shigaense]|uniref:Uncharacterized protein n=1 Tax=Mycobacterium shigaense TaxID=722731 RepID=A0A1Z4EDK3_9MYCO|nr:hypothetical protein MSG_00887 [Mycobacterium shigaense]
MVIRDVDGGLFEIHAGDKEIRTIGQRRQRGADVVPALQGG